MRKHAYSNILKILQPKKENFQIKNSDTFFHISTQNIDCGYSLEPPRRIIADAIFDEAEKSIPNKVVYIRPNDYPYITCSIKLLIRRRRRIYNKFKKTKNLYFWNRFKKLRNTVTNLIRNSKQDYFNKLESILTDETPNSKLFWKTSKQILKLEKSSQAIPTLNLNNKCAETDLQKANMLNEYFSFQSVVDDHNTSLPPPNTFSHECLEIFEIRP